MNKTLMFIQADMHRAINEGRRHMEISLLDLKELLTEVVKAESREQVEKCGHIFAWVRRDSLKEVREGRQLYCSVRRKKTDEYCEPVFCTPIGKKPVDAIAESAENTPLQADD